MSRLCFSLALALALSSFPVAEGFRKAKRAKVQKSADSAKITQMLNLGVGFAAGHSPDSVGPVMNEVLTKPPPPEGVVGKDVEYTVEGVAYQGYQALPPPDMKRVGGLLVMHAFLGLSDYEKARVEQFAGMGYVVFAGDLYGKGILCGSDRTCGMREMGRARSNMTKLKLLISTSTTKLLELTGADFKDKLVAMGYCLGGGNVLELARHPQVGASAGVTYKAVSAIHTLVDPFDAPAENGTIVTDVQVHHAELDFAGDAGLARLEAELKAGFKGTAAAWEIVKYSKVEHGWTVPGSTVYEARAALQAHESTEVFFRKALGTVDPATNPFQVLCRP